MTVDIILLWLVIINNNEKYLKCRKTKEDTNAILAKANNRSVKLLSKFDFVNSQKSFSKNKKHVTCYLL